MGVYIELRWFTCAMFRCNSQTMSTASSKAEYNSGDTPSQSHILHGVGGLLIKVQNVSLYVFEWLCSKFSYVGVVISFFFSCFCNIVATRIGFIFQVNVQNARCTSVRWAGVFCVNIISSVMRVHMRFGSFSLGKIEKYQEIQKKKKKKEYGEFMRKEDKERKERESFIRKEERWRGIKGERKENNKSKMKDLK